MQQTQLKADNNSLASECMTTTI